jgi:hypothetical protein
VVATGSGDAPGRTVDDANALFALEFDTRGRADRIRAFSVHLGAIIDTDLGRHMSADEAQAVVAAAARPRLTRILASIFPH